MTPFMHTPGPRVIEAWLDAAQRAEVRGAFEALYGELEAGAASERPICTGSGRCCDFGRFGHDLFATGLEAALVLGRLPEEIGLDADVIDRAHELGGCPFQIDRACAVHTVRPSGCRVFFCDASREPWMLVRGEHAAKSVREIHESFEIPYVYQEWRRLLDAFVHAGFTKPVRANLPELIVLTASIGRARLP